MKLNLFAVKGERNMLLWQAKFAHPATINTINFTRSERRITECKKCD